MNPRISASLLLGTAMSLSAAGFASAQDKTVKIGALSDQSGLYADLGGPGSTLAAQMAVEDSGLTAKGWKIDVISGDHQNKPDIGTAIARQWFDVENVDIIVDVPNSGVALAVNNVIKEKNGVYINSGAATADLTNAQCSPNTIHWTYDTYMVAKSTGQALVRAGNDSWFLLVADFAFGYALERDAGAVVVKEGGNVLGSVRRFTGREGNETTPTATENDRQVDTAAFNRAVFVSLKPDGTYFIPTVARHAAAEEQQIAGRHRLNISAER